MSFNRRRQRRLTAAPTVSGIGRWLAFFIIALKRFHLQLGDVRGAFLECHKFNREAGPLHLEQPRGGIPSLDPRQLLDVLKPVYGFNDVPPELVESNLTRSLRNGLAIVSVRCMCLLP